MIENYNPSQNPFLDIIYQDEDILVLNKPAGLLSVPGRDPKHNDSLQTRAKMKFTDWIWTRRVLSLWRKVKMFTEI